MSKCFPQPGYFSSCRSFLPVGARLKLYRPFQKFGWPKHGLSFSKKVGNHAAPADRGNVPICNWDLILRLPDISIHLIYMHPKKDRPLFPQISPAAAVSTAAIW